MSASYHRGRQATSLLATLGARRSVDATGDADPHNRAFALDGHGGQRAFIGAVVVVAGDGGVGLGVS